jgi:zinc transport system substrate-binding protein
MWLSPKEVKVQARTIASELSRLDPSNSGLYKERLALLETKLDDLDQEIKTILPKDHPVAILVSHPSFGYMARDYGLYQISIEFEGREPTQAQVLDIVKKAKGIKTIYTQPQHPSKGATVIGQHLGAVSISVDPYSEDYFNNMKKMAEEFKK